MEIIYADEKHINGIYALLCALEGEEIDKARFETVYLNNLENRDIYYLVAVENGAVAGFASLHIQQLLHHGGAVGEIQEIVVASEYRGQGMGSELYKSIKQIAVEQNCVLLEVCCNKIRTESHNFYLKQGMQGTHYKFTMWL